MDQMIVLDQYDRDLLRELLEGHRSDVLDGTYTGYAESQQDRLDSIADLLRQLGE